METVADVGCGNGRTIKRLLGLNDRLKTAAIIGFDIYKPYLVKAKTFYHNVVLCDVRYLPLRSNSVDLVLSTELIEHLDKADSLRFLAEFDRIVRR